MRCKSLVLALTVGLGGVASAQPGPPPPPVDTTTTTTTTDTNTTPPPITTPPPVTTAPPVQTAAPAPVQSTSEPATARPDGLSMALGIGYALPTSLETPNVTSFRLRLAGGLTFEPAFEVSNSSTKGSVTGVTPTPPDTSDKHTTFSLFTLARLPLISRGKADFEGLARVGFTSDKVNPDGDFNSTTTTSFDLGWGVAVGWWFSPHWNLSFNVTNALFTYGSTKKESPGAMGPIDTTTSTTEIGLIFHPTVFAMLHLYN